MTSTDHPTLDELAELAEGLLAPERELAVRAHLDTCTDCRRNVDALAQTGTALRSLGPLTMPADVAARIDQALAAAADSTPTDASAPGVDVIPNLADVRARRRLPTAPSSAAAGLVILAVVAIVIGLQHKSKPAIQVSLGSGTGSTVAPLVGGTQTLNGANGSTTTFSVQSTDRLYTAATLDSLVPRLAHGSAPGETYSGVQPPATVPSPTSLPQKAAGGTTPTTGPGAGGKRPVVSAPTKVGKHHRKANAPLDNAAGTRSGSAAASLPASLQPYRDDRQKVLQCAAFITNTAGATPLAVDLGRWSDPTSGTKNIPAIIMLFSVPGDTTKDIVVVAAPPCGEGDLLKYESVDRPS